MGYSQASQDFFVLHMSQFKRQGTFLEIGSNHPINHNNSYLLETEYDWRGIMIEHDPSFQQLYKQHRHKSAYYIHDAVTMPYKKALQQNNFPTEVDYLQIDVDVDSRSTLDTLNNLERDVFDSYTFGVITFEHDIYSGNYFDTRALSRQILRNRGYVLVFPDVQVRWQGRNVPFEDWYAHPSIVSTSLIEDIQTTESLFHSDIVQRLKNKSTDI